MKEGVFTEAIYLTKAKFAKAKQKHIKIFKRKQKMTESSKQEKQPPQPQAILTNPEQRYGMNDGEIDLREPWNTTWQGECTSAARNAVAWLRLPRLQKLGVGWVEERNPTHPTSTLPKSLTAKTARVQS